MKCSKDTMLLYAVTDRGYIGKQTLYEQVESALKGGVTCIQLREKNLDDASFLSEAKGIKPLCKRYNIPFIINDNVKVAIECKADGIHVGQNDMDIKDVRALVGDDMIVGVSAQTVEQAVRAEREGADYLGVGAMFQTVTKPDTCDVSYDELKKICNAVSIPVVAIGGIKRNNIQQLSGSNVDGIAVISAIFGSDDIENECRILKAMSKNMTNKKEEKSRVDDEYYR